LQKLNDQLLMDTRQLAVLLRMFKPADEVKLTVIRQGQPFTATARLAEHDVRAMEAGPFGFPVTAGHAQIQRFYNDVPAAAITIRPPAGSRMTSSVRMNDGRQTIILDRHDGDRHLKVLDGKGKVLYD